MINIFIKSTVALTLLLTSASLPAQKGLWLIAGQSNASGMGDRRTSMKYSSDACFDYVERGDSLRLLKDPVGEDGKYFGKANSGSIGPSFAWHLHQMTQDTIIVVSAARGGSSCSIEAETIYGTWAPTGTLPVFDACITKVKKAENLTRCKVQGVLWLQGERDSNAINDGKLTEEGYEKALKELIARFRKELGDAKLPFFLVLTGQYVNHPQPGYLAARRAQRKVAKEDPNIFLAPIDPWYFPEMGQMTDEIHYTQAAYNRIGEILSHEVIENHLSK